MSSPTPAGNDNFARQVERGELKAVEPNRETIEAMLERAKALLLDATDQRISAYGRQDHAYNALFGLAMAALALKGYRPTQRDGHRARVIDLLPQTAGWPASEMGVLRSVHKLRNQNEYEAVTLMKPKEVDILVGHGQRLAELVDQRWTEVMGEDPDTLKPP